MPRKIKPDLYTPTDEDVKNLLAHIEGTRMEVPVLLAALASLRRSEICALQAEDICDGYIVVNKAVVRDKDNNWIFKHKRRCYIYSKGNRFKGKNI